MMILTNSFVKYATYDWMVMALLCLHLIMKLDDQAYKDYFDYDDLKPLGFVQYMYQHVTYHLPKITEWDIETSFGYPISNQISPCMEDIQL